MSAAAGRYCRVWTGTRIKPQEAESVSGVKDVRFVGALETDFSALANSGNYGAVYLDLYRISPADVDRPAHGWRNVIQREYPFLRLENANILIRQLRLAESSPARLRRCVKPRRSPRRAFWP